MKIKQNVDHHKAKRQGQRQQGQRHGQRQQGQTSWQNISSSGLIGRTMSHSRAQRKSSSLHAFPQRFSIALLSLWDMPILLSAAYVTVRVLLSNRLITNTNCRPDNQQSPTALAAPGGSVFYWVLSGSPWLHIGSQIVLRVCVPGCVCVFVCVCVCVCVYV